MLLVKLAHWSPSSKAPTVTHHAHKELQVHLLHHVSVSKVWFAAERAVEVFDTLLLNGDFEVICKAVLAEGIGAPGHGYHLGSQSNSRVTQTRLKWYGCDMVRLIIFT